MPFGRTLVIREREAFTDFVMAITPHLSKVVILNVHVLYTATLASRAYQDIYGLWRLWPKERAWVRDREAWIPLEVTSVIGQTFQPRFLFHSACCQLMLIPTLFLQYSVLFLMLGPGGQMRMDWLTWLSMHAKHRQPSCTTCFWKHASLTRSTVAEAFAPKRFSTWSCRRSIYLYWRYHFQRAEKHSNMSFSIHLTWFRREICPFFFLYFFFLFNIHNARNPFTSLLPCSCSGTLGNQRKPGTSIALSSRICQSVWRYRQSVSNKILR